MLRRNFARRLQSSVKRGSITATNPTNFFSTFHATDKPSDQKLRSDIKHLGSILGSSIKVHDKEVFESVEELRLLGREWRKSDGLPAAFDDMVAKVKTFDAEKLHDVSRSFSTFLALANSAENHHRIRRLKDSLLSSGTEFGLWPKDDSCAGSIRNLLLKDKITAVEITDAINNQKVEIVLTAHPTEINRRTMLKKHNHIKDILDKADEPGLSLYERNRLESDLRAEISSIWDSDDLRRSKPSPVDEAKQGLAIVESVLWNAVPSFLRKLDDVTRKELGSALPLTSAPIKLASWMGGDRDGNPNVTPEITLEVSMLSRWMAATLFKTDIGNLRAALSMRSSSDELKALVPPGSREPYRILLRTLENRLQATIDWSARVVHDKSIYAVNRGFSSAQDTVKPLLHSSELLEPLLVMHRSLVETGMSDVSDGAIVDTIRRVASFGLALMPLDIRQESTRHSEALDAITRHLGLGSYIQWDETTRRNWLLAELSSKRPLMQRGSDLKALGFSDTVVDTLETFSLAASLESDSLGAYVISQCQQASDILAVLLLQQDAGVTPALRVVPLFETLDDLERSSDTVEALFSMDLYRGRICNKQEIMVGYSDSAKDAGRLAASWAQYNAQVSMSQIASKYKIELTFFHGKGGTVGRGGNPALFQAILAHPPNTIHGRFRVTEQGEMITQNLGQEAIAERTLDLFTAGVLSERFLERTPIKPEWAHMMEKLSKTSCDEYRSVVRGEERFVPYFRAATPEQELSGLNVGSRPAKRNPKGGVDSLRAIPWVFAWTQTRLNLPTWLGVGSALNEQMQSDSVVLKDMYRNWPWFQTLIDLLEMILVKSEARIAENYDAQLVSDEASRALGNELREKMAQTTAAVLSVSGNAFLQQSNPLLLRSLAVRNPYVDPLNVIQVELLLRLRQTDSAKSGLSEKDRVLLQDALLITINGIANGMRNSG